MSINTIESARDYISREGFLNEDSLKYTEAVVRKANGFADIFNLPEEDKTILSIAAYLHHIGRFLEERKSPMHQHNAYITLSDLGWDNDVCLLVLYHLDAPGLRKLIAPNSAGNLFHQELPPRLDVLDKILTLACLLTGPQGQDITLAERVLLAEEKYNLGHIRARHLRNITVKAQEWLATLFIGNLKRIV